jgi:hypothetical protein
MDLSHLRPILRDKRVWVALLSAVVVLAGLLVWAVRSYHREQARNGLNEFAPFANPALDLAFPRIVLDTEASRKLLEAGLRRRLWNLHSLGGTPPSMEVRLTNEGQRWFSVVGNQMIATFKVGTREATRVLELSDIFPTRSVRYLYRWTEFQPAGEVLGEEMPNIGEEYEGEALFLYENDHWRVMHWTTPIYDRAVERFKTLKAAP